MVPGWSPSSAKVLLILHLTRPKAFLRRSVDRSILPWPIAFRRRDHGIFGWCFLDAFCQIDDQQNDKDRDEKSASEVHGESFLSLGRGLVRLAASTDAVLSISTTPAGPDDRQSVRFVRFRQVVAKKARRAALNSVG